MRIAYFDCFAGAGGDMIVACLLDVGLDADVLKAQLATLGIQGLDIKITHTQRCGIQAVRFIPTAPSGQRHRNLEQVTSVINKSGISKHAKEKAVEIFNNLASAEARIHGKDAESIHFHEVGAVDSIIDIISTCIGIEFLGIEKVYCSELSIGGGLIDSAHGLMPVPAPATVELLKGLPVVGGPGWVELLTPTAAAILTAFVQGFGPLPPIRIEAAGYGAGSIESDKFPNLLRLIVGQSATADSAEIDFVCVLEACSDDTTGETIGFVTDTLLDSGALDVFTTPIYMKHNRPAVQVCVICKVEDSQRMQRLLFEQGITFGIRKQIIQRSRLARDFVTIRTDFGDIRIKTGSLDGRVVTAKPEFSDCAAAAKKHNVAVKLVMDAAASAFRSQAEKNRKTP